MADILIRDVDDDVIARIDGEAERLGVSRSEFLRRELRAISSSRGRTTRADLNRFSVLAADLLDDDAMAKAWE